MSERTVPWSKLQPMLDELKIAKGELAAQLGLSRNTVGRWAAKDEAPLWLLRLLHLEIEAKNYEQYRASVRHLLKPEEPRPLRAEDLKLGST